MNVGNVSFVFINQTIVSSPYSWPIHAIVWFVVGSLSLETILGNAMVIAAYRLDRSISKQVSNRYIVSLAISDLIIGIEGYPFFTIYSLEGDRWPLGTYACETWLFLDYTLCLVSILTVLLITIDRYMSVCHMPNYLKWQSPRKTLYMIIASWVLPAIVFGVLIYGWTSMSGQSRQNEDECSAPFIANPYVNASLYVAYYWTTLVAMLLLYKGIHKAARNLEKRAVAKERGHIALLLSQRLGTQVGVTLVLHSMASPSRAPAGHENVDRQDDDVDNNRMLKDSGYHTITTGLLSSTNVAVHQPKTSEQVKIPVAPINQHRSCTTSSIDQFSRSSTMAHLMMLDDSSNVDQTKNATIDTTADAISELFTDNSFSSILQLKTAISNIDDVSRLSISDDSTSVAVDADVEDLPEQVEVRRKTTTFAVVEREIIDHPTPITNVKHNWAQSLSQLINQLVNIATTSRRHHEPLVNNIIVHQRNSSSSADDESSSTNSAPLVVPPSPAPAPPRLTLNVPDDDRDRITSGPLYNRSMLSPTDAAPPERKSSLVSRKISSFSAITRERMVSTIFSPIVAIRQRRRTKAERRAHKAFRTITFIVGLFAVLWSPYYVLATVYGFCRGECIPSMLYTLSYYMCYLNSSGNPFAYALANRQFRTAFSRMLHGNFRRLT